MRRGDFSALIVNRNNIANAANTVIFNPFSGQQSGNNVVRSRSVVRRQARSSKLDLQHHSVEPDQSGRREPDQVLSAAEHRGRRNGTQNNFFSNQLRHQNYRAWLTRIDHRISSTQSIFGKYYHSFNPEDRQDWAGVVNGFPITRGLSIAPTTAATSTTQTRSIQTRLRHSRQSQPLRAGTSPGRTFDPATLGFAPASLAAMRGYQYLPRIMIRNLDATGRSDRRSARRDQTGTKAASARSTWARCNRR